MKVKLGQYHKFPCGCDGILPENFEEPNKFARIKANKLARIINKRHFGCRVSYILLQSQLDAKKGKYAPIPLDTPHSVIRKMMEEPNCERCNEPLDWIFGRGKTPHLHHNHSTGEVYGFVHSHCNHHAVDKEIQRLKSLIRSISNGISR